MLNQSSGVMYAIMGLCYCSLLFLLIEYVRLLVIDPSDERLRDRQYHPEGIEEKDCELCQCKVAKSSYHCHNCKRCVEEFDHHCTFVNNCIGKENYSIFIRLLIGIIIHTSSGIGIAIWLMLTLTGSYKWIAVVFGALNAVIFLEVTVLAIFHCYISFCLYKTTLQVLRGDEASTGTRKIYKASAETGEQSDLNLVKVNNVISPQ